MAKPKQAAALFEQLDKAIQGGEGDELAGKMKVGRLSSAQPGRDRWLA